MRKPHIIRSIALVFLSIFCIQAETNSPQSRMLSAEEQNQIAEIALFAENALINAFNGLQKIEAKLTEIALLMKKGLFKGTNIPATMMVLTENKMTINTLLQNQAAITSLKDPLKYLEVTFIISEFCNAFIPYFNKQIQNNFKNAKSFNFQRFIQHLQKAKMRSNLSHLETTALKKGLRVTHARLKVLDLTIKNVGLTWYNKGFRALDKWFVTPLNKYHVPTISFYTTLIGVLGSYSLWSYGHHFLENQNTPETIKDYVKFLHKHLGLPLVSTRAGDAKLPKIGENKKNKKDKNNDNNSNKDKNEKKKLRCAPEKDNSLSSEMKIDTKAGLFATADLAVRDFIMQKNPLGSLAGGFILTSAYKAWTAENGPRDRLIKKRNDVWNFLRGGEYLNTFQPGLIAMEPTVSFKDMVGLDEVKEAFYPLIQYIDNPELLMRIDATPEKGWLLTGPTRTGKSFSVQCLCGEIKETLAKRGLPNIKFFNIPAPLITKHGIKAILDEVYENAPAVIFIDEIDLLGLSRIGNNQLLSDFLTALQSSMNADPSKVVIVVAATNNPENIDKALRQNGRLGKEIRFEYPSKKYRIEFIIRELTNMALNLKDFDIETLANKTNGRSFEDLKRVIRNAMTRSWMHGESLTQELLEESIDTELNNIIMFNRKDLPENERRIVATHFAGRALAGLNVETYQQLDKITIYARMTEIQDQAVWDNYAKKDEKEQQKKIEYGVYLTQQSQDTIHTKNESIILNEVTILLAGFAAEELLLGPCGFTCHRDDRDKAYKLIEDLVFGGLDQTKLPKEAREELKTRTYNLFKQCHHNAMNILMSHREALIAIAEELLKKQILNVKEIQTIIKNIENPEPPVIEVEKTSDQTKEVIENPAQN